MIYSFFAPRTPCTVFTNSSFCLPITSLSTSSMYVSWSFNSSIKYCFNHQNHKNPLHQYAFGPKFTDLLEKTVIGVTLIYRKIIWEFQKVGIYRVLKKNLVKKLKKTKLLEIVWNWILQYVLLVLSKSICLFLGLERFLWLETCGIFSPCFGHFDIWLSK